MGTSRQRRLWCRDEHPPGADRAAIRARLEEHPERPYVSLDRQQVAALLADVERLEQELKHSREAELSLSASHSAALTAVELQRRAEARADALAQQVEQLTHERDALEQEPLREATLDAYGRMNTALAERDQLAQTLRAIEAAARQWKAAREALCPRCDQNRPRLYGDGDSSHLVCLECGYEQKRATPDRSEG